jgi:hypothetical protein
MESVFITLFTRARWWSHVFVAFKQILIYLSFYENTWNQGDKITEEVSKLRISSVIKFRGLNIGYDLKERKRNS